jgi:hypothetical protein
LLSSKFLCITENIKVIHPYVLLQLFWVKTRGVLNLHLFLKVSHMINSNGLKNDLWWFNYVPGRVKFMIIYSKSDFKIGKRWCCSCYTQPRGDREPRKIRFEEVKSQKQYYIIDNYVCIYLNARVNTKCERLRDGIYSKRKLHLK